MKAIAYLLAAFTLLAMAVPTSASDWYMQQPEPASMIGAATTGYDEPLQPNWNHAVIPVASGRLSSLGITEPDGEIGCTDIACEPVCPPPPWAHRTGVFGELLFLRARNADVAYGVPVDGAIVPPVGVAPIQVGRIGVVDPDFQTGFRFGAMFALDNCSSIVATYSHFESNTSDAMTTNAPLVIRSMVLHSGTANAAADFLDASAYYGINFDLIDVDYRFVWVSDSMYAVNLLVGLRYAGLDQDFNGIFTQAGQTDSMFTDISFDGAGLRLGIDAERHRCGTGLLAYGKANASFVAGEFRGRYFQGSSFDPVIVDTNWKAGRIVSMLDLELGAGWQSPGGCFRFTLGYLISGWFNTVKTEDFIGAVQTNNFVGLGNTLTFDGLVTRAEVRF